jgi:hypothetical protein
MILNHYYLLSTDAIAQYTGFKLSTMPLSILLVGNYVFLSSTTAFIHSSRPLFNRDIKEQYYGAYDLNVSRCAHSHPSAENNPKPHESMSAPAPRGAALHDIPRARPDPPKSALQAACATSRTSFPSSVFIPSSIYSSNNLTTTSTLFL